MLFLITYDFNQPQQEYPDFFNAIENLGDTHQLMSSVWLLNTDKSASVVHLTLARHIQHSDYLLIDRVTRNTKGNFNQAAINWLNQQSMEP
ncbi:hypothetical protein [uncultured Anaeromusa sp.]|uniref:hypothetical protein n=1 Tax=uncultured Anaeromusa sp. TaxID=673273 RepID=UPI0029C7D3FA|nr:hypothetical protein [uncultured Anaeromusa sp.]